MYTHHVMRTLIISAIITAISMVFIIACDVTNDPCGGGSAERYYQVTDFTTGIGKVDSVNYRYNDVVLIESDTLSFNDLAIKMKPVQDFYSSTEGARPFLNIIPAAYACPPVHNVSTETITDIRITADKTFNEAYPAGENVAELFDISLSPDLFRSGPFDLTEFLSWEPTAPELLIFTLKEAPTGTLTVRFTVTYQQDGRELDEYIFTTQSVTITP